MKVLGILRTFAFCLLVSALHGPRGVFCSNVEVKCSTESPIVDVSEISENHEKSGPASGSAPVAKSDFVFENAKWDDSQLASAFLFIEELLLGCKRRFDAHIPAAKFNKLDGVCRSVYSYLDIFRWKQVRGLHENPYEDALKPDKFKDYAEWLEKHLPEIKKSMINMHNETGKYSGRQLQTNMKKLVSKYGFVCNGDWYTGIVPLFDARGKGALTFLEAFDYLRKTLDKVLKNAPTKSTEA
ncbi:LOW QUALITY PROTEIN: hypothetical protein X943_000571 [Babesia divergens]|uniref:Uncharacterized protein n=1 Tax=Babesia divergens TaxID=32595 RepID=A0AAD9GCN1_BABDI|nr:LOW QUALITY PROTEIN: hypothetical protein X943_000571 [Babesia divergens]